MTSCYSTDIISNTHVNTEIYMTTYNVILVCLGCYIVGGMIYIVRWAKKRFQQVHSDIYDQQEEIMGYTQEKLDKFIHKYDNVLNKLENQILYLQSIVQIENTHNNDLVSSITYMTHQIQELEHNQSQQVLIGYHGVHMNYAPFSTPHSNPITPIFCPKNTTDLTKYLRGSESYFLLSCLAQLPNYQTFTFDDYYYGIIKDKPEFATHTVKAFLDANMNIISNGSSWRQYNKDMKEPHLAQQYKEDFVKVQEYCRTFGVKCV